MTRVRLTVECDDWTFNYDSGNHPTYLRGDPRNAERIKRELTEAVEAMRAFLKACGA